jgi:hypothetical protein
MCRKRALKKLRISGIALSLSFRSRFQRLGLILPPVANRFQRLEAAN